MTANNKLDLCGSDWSVRRTGSELSVDSFAGIVPELSVDFVCGHCPGRGRHVVPRPQSAGSSDGFLFSVQTQMEGLRQMEGSLVDRQVVHRSPEIENIAVSAAVGVETLEDVLTQMDREGTLSVCRLAMDRAKATALLAAPAQVPEQSQVLQDTLHGDLLP